METVKQRIAIPGGWPEGCAALCYTDPAPNLWYFKPGDLLIVDLHKTPARGELVAVCHQGNEQAEVRQYWPHEAMGYMLSTINCGLASLEEPVIYGDEVEIIGRVCGFVRCFDSDKGGGESDSEQKENLHSDC